MQIKLAIWLKAAMNLRMLLWLLQATAKTSFDQMSFFFGLPNASAVFESSETK